MQVVILSQTKEDQTIEEFADEVMKHDGMQAYIQRLGFQIQKKMKEPVDDDSFPW